jgi:peptidyl-prolyl cis-trans isomerase SurA
MTLFKWRHYFQTRQTRSSISVALRMTSFCLLFLVFRSGFVNGSEIDRLIAAVNGVAITEGDLNLARSLNEILSYGRNAAAGSRSDEIERLIDRELMRQELKNFSMMEVEEIKIEASMQSLRDAFAAKGGLSALLQRTGLLESELISYIRLESSILRFVDFRFRPFVSVLEADIRAYYEKRLIPQLRESKIETPSLDQISAKIEIILREEKINAVLDQWMKEIRRSSRIEYFNDAQ